MSTEKAHRTKFAVGHYLTERPDDPKSFLELAKRYADRLREVYFAWPGLLNGRPSGLKKENEEERIISDLKYCREHGMKLDLLANATCYGERLRNGIFPGRSKWRPATNDRGLKTNIIS